MPNFPASASALENLPPGSIVINQPVPVRVLPESVIWAIGISATGLILGLAAMVVAFLRLRRARDALDESERRYRAVVEDQTESDLPHQQ